MFKRLLIAIIVAAGLFLGLREIMNHLDVGLKSPVEAKEGP